MSGGCVEGEVLAAAAEVIADGELRRLRYGVADAAAWEVGLPCGGTIEMLVQPVAESGFPPTLFDAIAQARATGDTLVTATDPDNGRTVIGPAASPDAFVNRYRPPRRLLVIGAVQIAQALVGIARELGMDCTVIDPRGRFLTAERFPATTLDDRWPDEAVAALRPDSATAVVTLSHDVQDRRSGSRCGTALAGRLHRGAGLAPQPRRAAGAAGHAWLRCRHARAHRRAGGARHRRGRPCRDRALDRRRRGRGTGAGGVARPAWRRINRLDSARAHSYRPADSQSSVA